jgi:hypothetical protein
MLEKPLLVQNRRYVPYRLYLIDTYKPRHINNICSWYAILSVLRRYARVFRRPAVKCITRQEVCILL